MPIHDPVPARPIPVICDRCRAEGCSGADPFAAFGDLLDFDPVPRRSARADGWDAEVQRAYIAALSLTGSDRAACRAVGKSAFGVTQLLAHPDSASFADERGSVVAVSDASGNLVGSRNAYDEYGNPQGGTVTGRFGYTGQAWIPEANLWYYRARMYSSALGRFMQTDPIGFEGGMNIYAYVFNDPANLTDPSGLGNCLYNYSIEYEDKNNNHRRDPGEPSFPDSLMETGRVCLSHQPSLFWGGGGGSGSTGHSAPQNRCPAVPAGRNPPRGNRWLAQALAGLADPLGLPVAEEAADQAYARSAEAYPHLLGINDTRDAYRHFYWVAAMTRMLGASRALAYAASHEVGSADIPGSQMDDYNNHVAAVMMSDPANANIPTADLAERAVSAGCLEILR